MRWANLLNQRRRGDRVRVQRVEEFLIKIGDEIWIETKR